MKKYIIILFTCFGSISYAQSNDNFKIENNKLIVSEVVQTEGKSKSGLYQDALLWVTKTFNNPKTVIQTKDADLGLITLKTVILISNDYYGKPSQWYNVNMTIQVKDGRYKYEITDIIYNFDLSDIGKFIQNPVDVNNSGAVNEVKNVFAPIVSNLKSQMSKPVEDW